MKKISIKEFEKRSNIEIIQELIKLNNGYVTSKIITEYGIHRMYLKIMKEKGLIKRVGKGTYIGKNTKPDKLYMFSTEFPSIVYSHMTSLSILGFPIKLSNKLYDITVKNNYFNYKLKKNNVFYVNENIYCLGLIETKTPMGNTIRVYDIERSICDIIKSKKRMDMDNYKIVIQEYFKYEKRDINKLLEYANKLGIKDKVMMYIEIFS